MVRDEAARSAPAQTWSADGYQRNAAFVPAYGLPLVERLAPRPGERILDLGCGDGILTAAIAAAGAGVVGLDSSQEMIDAARARGIDAHVANGEELGFDAEFDAVFSNAALHWMRRADAVLSGIHRALKPGGRFVAELGGHGCVAAIVVAVSAVLARHGAPFAHPWFFPTVAEYGALLEQRGFAVTHLELYPRPTPLPTGMRGWLETFAGPMLTPLPAAARPGLLDEITALLAPVLCDSRGNWTADYVRLRVVASKP
jgi:trans-aconitate methyltransferase